MAGSESRQTLAFVLCRNKIILQKSQIAFEVFLVDALKGQKVGKFGNLRVQLIECRILVRYLLAQEELRDHEDSEQEDNGKHEGGQSIDKARPIINLALVTP